MDNQGKDFDFGVALAHLKAGRLVARSGWNGKGMWCALVHGAEGGHKQWHIDDGLHPAIGYPSRPFIGMKSADDQFVPWVASQSDMLAEDWTVVD